MSEIAGYFEKIAATYKGGQATEHSYRPALYELFFICSCAHCGQDLAYGEES